MIKILFVCHGNICRSPMAEYILKDRIIKDKLHIYVESRATSFEEIGNDIYWPVKEILEKHCIKYERHKAKRISQEDYDNFDLIYVMDGNNLYAINRIVKDTKNKIRKLREFDIEDPWYSGNFEKVYEEIAKGIEMLIKNLR